jgi:hypothetical protein
MHSGTTENLKGKTQMDKFQHKLRLLIVTGSAVGFIGGWGLLAHSGKPVSGQPVDNTSAAMDYYPSATPTPLPPIDFKSLESVNGGDSSNNNIQVMPSVPNTQSTVPTFRPRFRTRTS